MRSTAVRLAATLVTKVERSPQAGLWSRVLSRALIPVGSAAGLATALLTDTERPPHGINPAWNLGASLPHTLGSAPYKAHGRDEGMPSVTGVAAVSGGLIRQGLRSRLLGYRLLVATNSVNLAVQLFQLGCASTLHFRR